MYTTVTERGLYRVINNDSTATGLVSEARDGRRPVIRSYNNDEFCKFRGFGFAHISRQRAREIAWS